MPRSKTQRKNSAFDPSARWLSLYPYWQTVERVALPAAKRFLRKSFPKNQHYVFRERLHSKLSSLDPLHLIPYMPLAYHGFVLACYHRLRFADVMAAKLPNERNRRRRALEQRAYELIFEAYRPLARNYRRFLEYHGITTLKR